MDTKRGIFVVFEGADKSGKTTQSKILTEWLLEKNTRVILLRFPDRSTAIGKLIDQYLTKKINLPMQSVHLLFSANRWELNDAIETNLRNGFIVVADRYTYSGIVYSQAKGMNSEWCKGPDKGLIAPDLVVYMDTFHPTKEFGDERFENPEFQLKLKLCYNIIRNEGITGKTSWRTISSGNVYEIQEKIRGWVDEIIDRRSMSPVYTI